MKFSYFQWHYISHCYQSTSLQCRDFGFSLLQSFQPTHNHYFVFEFFQIVSERVQASEISFLYRHSYNEKYIVDNKKEYYGLDSKE